MVRALVAFGADVNQLNRFHQTPLDTAELVHKDDIVKFLREVGGAGGNPPHFVNSPQLPVQEEGHGMGNEDGMRPEDVMFGEGGNGGEGGRDRRRDGILSSLQVVT